MTGSRAVPLSGLRRPARRRSALVAGILAGTAAGVACTDVLAPPDLGNCNPSPTTTWTHLGLGDMAVTALAENPWGLFAGTAQHGVFRCEAQTGRWEPVGLDHAVVSALLFVPGSPPRLLAGMRPFGEQHTDAAVYATEDGGRTWVPSDGGLAVLHERRQWALSLALDPRDPDLVYMGQFLALLRSNDGGRSWRYVFGGPDREGRGIHTILPSPEAADRVWAGGANRWGDALVLVSGDAGESWEDRWILPWTSNIILSLAVDPSDPERLWAGADGGVLQSEDGGHTWELSLANEGRELPIERIHTVLADRDPGRVYAVGRITHTFPIVNAGHTRFPWSGSADYLGLFRSEDGGTSWTELATPDFAAGSEVATFDSEGRLLIGTGRSDRWESRGGVWRFEP